MKLHHNLPPAELRILTDWIAAELAKDAAQVGRNAERQDPPSGLGPKDEHAVAEGDAPTRGGG